ncbi:hypothetical protein ElyMa_000095700 [Elysia marginata]|uniref:Uncharacterized protein n=1 Tax=Elysia marginata TaxID=1093978 RepID=A0AAV4EJ29_9GAST|nr:hypothetical protein ElyMa_000095700 [Elysia marginata]
MSETLARMVIDLNTVKADSTRKKNAMVTPASKGTPDSRVQSERKKVSVVSYSSLSTFYVARAVNDFRCCPPRDEEECPSSRQDNTSPRGDRML